MTAAEWLDLDAAPRIDLVAALRAALEVTADSLTEYPDDITALAVNRAITEALA